MIRQSSAARRLNRLANRKASPFSKQSIAHAARVMAPTFFALAICAGNLNRVPLQSRLQRMRYASRASRWFLDSLDAGVEQPIRSGYRN